MMHATPSIPVVDFGPWHSAPAQRQAIGDALAAACREYGFVYIVNHGVPDALVDEIFAVSHRLFGLEPQQKRLAPHPPGYAVHRGYSWPGLEKVSNVYGHGADVDKLRQVEDCKESYEVGSEGNEAQPNVWLPENVLPGFRDFTTSFYWTCHKVSIEIITALALGIGLDTAEPLLSHHSGHGNQLRLLHYPPVQAELVREGKVARMPAHCDWGTVTMLFQDACGGLQVEDPHKPGSFIDASPIKGALCLNVGDVLMRWSNDHLKSTLHRVALPPADRVMNEAGNSDHTPPRYSVVYFVCPDAESVIQCLPSCQSAENPPKYTPIQWEEYRLMRGSTQYEVK
ncbi:Clavaminate synthase-like protein [Exidia glandulosa HHB12029]|uniref:Clavaminate synthase-like protein n=1 Tax=Exidia glandulosa HHB12029 TaxID=1314781 RepID=A0A165NT84_EXIGL|nr:Clavaminate synthase-like protein [Exidia glandulosa HHB12029]